MSSNADYYDFAMSFVSTSDAYKRQFIDKWRRVLANFMVEAAYDDVAHTTPYSRSNRVYSNRRRQVILKDPETHKALMTYAAKLMQACFGDKDRAYISARPRG